MKVYHWVLDKPKWLLILLLKSDITLKLLKKIVFLNADTFVIFLIWLKAVIQGSIVELVIKLITWLA